jgi:hypothetical protein
MTIEKDFYRRGRRGRGKIFEIRTTILSVFASEAKQSRFKKVYILIDCFVANAPRNDNRATYYILCVLSDLCGEKVFP